ncbi:T9SS sorting signal type C domain-containing protein [Flavobacterium sp. TBRC 19031]|uniref:T9SS sorting signal type C domain-containing protein n=1 Tax=Flavobacterium mekongense TaxID=3379707 RepID=UPI00399B5CE9
MRKFLEFPKSTKFVNRLLLMLFFVFGVNVAEAQVTTLQDWSVLYNNTSTGQQTISYTVPTGSNSNRVLAVAIASSRTSTGTRTVSISYGGRTLTLANGDMSSSVPRQHTAIYYLNESGLDLANNSNLVFTINGGTTRVTTVWAAVFDYVDQTNPLTDSKNYNSGTSTADPFVLGTPLATNTNDQAVLVVSSIRSGNTNPRTITFPTNFTSVDEETWTNTDGVRNAVGNRSIPTSNVTSTCSTNLSGAALGSMTAVSFKGCVAPTVSAGSALVAICQGGTSAALGGSVGGSATGGTWTSSVPGGTFSPNATTLNATWTPPAAYTGTATLTLTTSGGSCGVATASKTLVVNPIPTAVTASASVTSTCSGAPFNLTASATSNSGTAATLINENFNGTAAGWTTINNSTNGTPASAAWTLRANGYTRSTTTYNSNDASQFYLSDSDAQGSGSTTATILQSPTFSTVGLASATLSFFHYYRDYDTTDFANVEISTDGSNWTVLNSYTTTQGASNGFVEATFSLASYLNQPTVSIRFKYDGIWAYYWAIDNVSVTGNYTTAPAATFAWTSTPAGFTSAVQNPTGVTQTVATVYNVTATNSYGCTASASTASVTMAPANVGGSVSGTATICSGATSGVLTLSGHTGTIVRWESSVSPFTTWTPIANTATTYTSGPLTEETKFRAVVGTCNEAYSSEATLSFASTTWNGTAWSNGNPAANKALVITGNYTSPGSTFDLQGCSLTVQNNAVVTIVPQDTVILSGALTVATGSTVTFEAKAHLIQSGTTNLNSGNIIVKANSSPIKRLDYTLWSAPVAGQQLQAFSPLTLANRFYNYDSNTNFYTVVASPSTTAFEAAKGVLVRVANNHSASQPQSWLGTFTGVPNSGTYTIPLANFGPGKRFTLVGNPYPSPMDAEAFITNANNAAAITGTLYLWRKTNGSNKPSYCTLNLGGFISNGEDHSNAVAALPYQVIQTGQGFFVEGTGAGSGNVVFDNTMRIDDHTNSFLRTANTAQTTNSVERNRVWLNVTNTAGAFSQAMIGYVTNATNDFDLNYDGKYINDGEIALASVLNAEPYAIQCKALPFSATDVIPMQFTATTAGNYSIAIDRVDGLFANGQNVYLRDNLTGTVHNLSEGAYSFASESGTFAGRFEVLFQSTTLGVTDPVLTENQVVIYKTPTNEISISTGNFVMDNVMIYDLAGRLLFQQKDINDSQTLIKVGFATEVLLVKIKTQDGKSVSKKVLFPRTSLKKEIKISTIQVAEDE